LTRKSKTYFYYHEQDNKAKEEEEEAQLTLYGEEGKLDTDKTLDTFTRRQVHKET